MKRLLISCQIVLLCNVVLDVLHKLFTERFKVTMNIFIVSFIKQLWFALGGLFAAALALLVMKPLGWHWYLGLATAPVVLVIPLFLVGGCVAFTILQ